MASLTPTPKQQFFNSSGAPLVAGKVFTYAGGTTTPAPTFTSQSAVSTNTNPIILDAQGRCEIWLQPTLAYKYVVTDANDVQQYTVDNILVPPDLLSFGSPPPIGNVAPNTGAFTTLSATGDVTFSGFGATQLQSGATTDRPALPVEGMLRYNAVLGQFEGYSSAGWGSIGGAGATGGGATESFYENDKIVTASYTIGATKNAMTTGPLTFGPVFTGEGSIAGTTLTVASVAGGLLVVGTIIEGAGVTLGTTVTAYLTATGEIGTYTVSESQSVSTTTITAPIIVTVLTACRLVVL